MAGMAGGMTRGGVDYRGVPYPTPTPRSPDEDRYRAEKAAEEAKTRAQQQADLAASQRREDTVFTRNQAALPPAGGGNVSTSGTANNNMMGAFDTFMSKYGKMGDGTSSSSSMSGSGGLSGGSSPAVKLDTGAIAAGDAAAYSRAKDQVGQSQQGLQKALTNKFAARGMRGSSIEGRAIGSAAEAGAGELADMSRSQAIGAGDRAIDLAKTQYQGNIEQRGQDISERGSIRSSEATAQSSKLASILGLWNAFNSGQRY